MQSLGGQRAVLVQAQQLRFSGDPAPAPDLASLQHATPQILSCQNSLACSPRSTTTLLSSSEWYSHFRYPRSKNVSLLKSSHPSTVQCWSRSVAPCRSACHAPPFLRRAGATCGRNQCSPCSAARSGTTRSGRSMSSCTASRRPLMAAMSLSGRHIHCLSSRLPPGAQEQISDN